MPELGWLPPKGNALEVAPAPPNEKAGLNEGAESVSFDVKDADDLKREDEDVPPTNPGRDDEEPVLPGLGSEDVGVVDGKLKGDGLVVGAAGLGVKPVAGAMELREVD